MRDSGVCFGSIVFFRDVLQQSFFSELRRYYSADKSSSDEAAEATSGIALLLSSGGEITLFDLLKRSQNHFSMMCERKEEIPHEIRIIAENDIKIIIEMIGNTDFFSGKTCDYLKPLFSGRYPKTDSPANEILDDLEKFWRVSGCGDFADGNFFRWDGKSFSAVELSDKISYDDLAGYEDYKDIIRVNTAVLCSGNPANNILLAGSRGCGKSSLIKAAANAFAGKGLKLVEVSKKNILRIDSLFRELAGRGLNYIIFIDDISFDENEHAFTEFKSAMEGCVAEKPANIVIYATSNRRHMVSEKPLSGSYDIYEQDTDNEKISLSDRFGITLLFLPPDQQEYLSMVKKIAEKSNLDFDEKMRTDAIRWAVEQKGRSGRTAKQFIIYYKGLMSINPGGIK